MKVLFLSLGSRPLYRIALCCAAFLNANPAASDCPSGSYAVVGGLVNPPVIKAHIYTLSRSKSAWTRVPHDVISLSRLAPVGELPAAFFPQPLSARWFRVDFQSQWWARPFFSDQDVIVTPGPQRGLKVAPSDLRVFATRAGCAGGRMWEWEQSALGVSGPGARQFLYLLECRRPPEGVSTTSGDHLPAVVFDAKALRIESPGFRYQMNRGNQMLFDRLEASAGDGAMEVFLEDGNFDIRADFKNFFEMHFTSGNVGSKVVANRDESASGLARLSFNLKLLFLKLDLQLNTDLLFFRDAVFLPMIMKIPRDAWRYVNPGSGVLYSWYPTPGTRLVEGWIDMPRRRIFKTKADINSESRQVAERHCQADGLCRFRVAVGRGPDNRIVLMELIVAKGMVNSGFFPQYVADAVPEVGELGWSWSGSNSKRRREGIYFELSQLAKGEHSFEIWLRLIPQDANPEAESFCPSGTALREISR